MRKLNIEVTTRCNLNCTMCMRQVWKEESGDMGLGTYEALLPVFPDVETVNLFGIGEPLLNENILEMIRLGKLHLPSTGTFSLTTNATALDRQMARQLVAAGVDDIVVSIDSATGEAFRDIRQGANLDDVLRNIGLLRQAKEELGSPLPRIGIEFVAMNRNIAELPRLVDMAAQYGVSFIIVSNLLPHTEAMTQEILYDFNSDEAIELFKEAEAEARRRNVDLTLDNLDVENYAYALFGVPPLRDKLRSANPVRRDVPGYDERMEQKFKLFEEIVAKARERNILLNFKNLLSRDGAHLDEVAHIFEVARVRAQKHGIVLDLPLLIPRTRRECGFIKDRISFISWDGFVRPCNNLCHSYKCYINNREKSITSVSFGNVLKQDFRAIWSSREYRNFRKQVEKFDFAPCGDCPHAEGCFALLMPVFRKDCYEYAFPCGDCPWARGLLKCM